MNNNMNNKMKLFLKNPKLLKVWLARKKIINLDDEDYLKIIYRAIFNAELNLDNPITYNEKLQWLKLYDRNPLYTKIVDKYEVREYIKEKIGEEYLIPCLGVYNRVEDIDFDALPNQFVIKATHDSGTVIICRDKSKFDKKKAIKKLNTKLKRNFYYQYREWPYKNVKPRIVIEKYMKDGNSIDLHDYKIFCFDGEPKMIYVTSERASETGVKINYYDMNFKRMKFKSLYCSTFEYKIKKPKTFEKMKELSKILSKDMPHVRVDFYEINGKIYFSELTLSDGAGFNGFEPNEYDKIIGDWIKLDKAYIYKQKTKN